MLNGKRGIALLAVVLLMTAATAYGFTNPPPFANNPKYVPGGTGRDVKFDFSNPSGEPYTLLGPTWDTQGPDGDWTCDNVVMLGAVAWYDTVPSWGGHQGLFGINNTGGQQPVSGSLTFHVNNFPDPNWHKLVWDEAVYYEGAGANINHGLFTGPGPNIPAPWVASQAILNVTPLNPPPGYMENLSGEIRPNPDWEEIKFDFFVPAGAQAYLDSFEIATLCDVPEPGTWVLLITAGIAMLLLAWRRRGK